MYPPTASADSGPTFWAPDAVPRIVLTSPRVRSASISIAWVPLIPGPGSVAPSIPTRLSTAERKRQAKVAPAIWAIT